MDNLRKLNAYHGMMTKKINEEATDSEIDSFVRSTLGDWKKLFMNLPDVMEHLTFEDLMDINMMDDDKIEEVFMRKCFPNGEPTEEEMEEAAKGLIQFTSLLGIDISEDDP
jgi:hypothetical protein